MKILILIGCTAEFHYSQSQEMEPVDVSDADDDLDFDDFDGEDDFEDHPSDRGISWGGHDGYWPWPIMGMYNGEYHVEYPSLILIFVFFGYV